MLSEGTAQDYFLVLLSLGISTGENQSGFLISSSILYTDGCQRGWCTRCFAVRSISSQKSIWSERFGFSLWCAFAKVTYNA